MDMNRLEKIIYETIVEMVATRVVEALQARSKQAVVLFTGTDLGLDKAVPNLKTLMSEGFRLRCVLSSGGRKTLTPELRSHLDMDSILAESITNPEPEVDSLLDGQGLVLVPALSITTAAKVASCMRDCLGASLVARALERGIPVIAAVDGCCPDNPKRHEGLFLVTEAYKVRLRSHLETLQSYGIQLIRAGKLAEAVRGSITLPVVPVHTGAALSTEPASRRTQPLAAIPVAVATQPAVSPAFATGEKRLFSRSHALDCKEGSELRLERNILVTPLAMDVLRNRNVRLIQT